MLRDREFDLCLLLWLAGSVSSSPFRMKARFGCLGMGTGPMTALLTVSRPSVVIFARLGFAPGSTSCRSTLSTRTAPFNITVLFSSPEGVQNGSMSCPVYNGQ